MNDQPAPLLSAPEDATQQNTNQVQRSRSWIPHARRLSFRSLFGAGVLLLLVVGFSAAVVLVQTNQDTRQQASGGAYPKCDYGANNNKPVCLDSEPTYGNCVICKNGEKHILPNAECGTALCAQPRIKTCSDGNKTYNEGGTACLSFTECVKCRDGHWVPTARWECGVGSNCFQEPTRVPPSPTRTPTLIAVLSPTRVSSPTPRLSSTPTPRLSITPTPRLSATPTLRLSVTPTLRLNITPTPTTPKQPDGSRCSTNESCLSGSCVPTPYGNYCGTTTTPKCTIGQIKCENEGSIAYQYSCNSNGFFVKSERCDGGCAGSSCKTGVCSKGTTRCVSDSVMERCNDSGTAWVKSSCWSGQKCTNTACGGQTPTPVPPKQPDGSRCSTNANCLSGSCVPTPYGNYCGTTTTPKCSHGQTKCQQEGSTYYVYSCNSNGFFVKTQRCDGGCAGNACNANVCVKGSVRCASSEASERCADDGTAWIKSSCWSSEECVNGTCVSKSVNPTAVPKLPDGSRCGTNESCQSGSCVPTPYGNYCGTTNSERCTAGQDQCRDEYGTSYVYSCNSNGFFVKSERCDGGCANGMCNTGVCTANTTRCRNATDIETCNASGTAWVARSCNSGQWCYAGQCGDVAPPLASCNLSSSCAMQNATCATDTSARYICKRGEWVPIADGMQIITENCSQAETDLYLRGFDKATKLIDVSVVKMICENKNNTGLCAYTTNDLAMDNAFVMNCWPDRICDEHIANGKIPEAHRVACMSHYEDQATRTVSHEWAHNWAYQNEGSFDVESFNEAIGCKSEFLGGYVFEHEQPVSDYGATQCREAFAESTTVFIYNPCILRRDFPVQYDWFTNHPDSPFSPEDGCNN